MAKRATSSTLLIVIIVISTIIGLCGIYVYVNEQNRDYFKNDEEEEKENSLPEHTQEITKNNWIVLLTMCVNPWNKNNEKEIEYRKNLYKTQLQKWLDGTKYPIFVVESSNTDDIFNEINDPHHKLHPFVFYAEANGSSSIGELKSLQYALEQMKNENSKEYQNATHILKVTGRYYLDGIEDVLNKVEQNKDLYVQIHRKENFQNTEYFGIRKEKMTEFTEGFINDKLMETNFYGYSVGKEHVFIGPFKNDVPRGGDKMVINPL
jgi:hypothetical protein